MMQVVDNNANFSYVYSAYVDDRQAQDVQQLWLPVLRLFVLFRRTEHMKLLQHWRCLLWNERLSQSLERMVVGWTELKDSDSFTE